MGLALQTDLVQRSRGSLGELDVRFAAAVKAAEARGASSADEVGSLVALDGGTQFVPDGSDVRSAGAGIILGGIAGVFGAVLLAIAIDSAPANAWMSYVGPALLAFGGYFVWTGRDKVRAARAAPRTTGLYLFDDVLLYVSTVGCRVFPVEHLRGFERQMIGGRTRQVILYNDSEGRERDTILFDLDVNTILGEWLARAKGSKIDRSYRD